MAATKTSRSKKGTVGKTLQKAGKAVAKTAKKVVRGAEKAFKAGTDAVGLTKKRGKSSASKKGGAKRSSAKKTARS